jgi:acyl-CoA synthetase (AMP-forming)/AMP-acid ligase II
VETLADAMDEAVRHDGDREAYVDGADRITFADWERAADGLAGALLERGIGPGDVVALMLPSSIDYAVCFAALAKVGAIVTGLSTRLGAQEVDAILALCRPALIIRDTGLPLPAGSSVTPVLQRTELAGLYQRSGPGGCRPRVRADDPAVIIWTSGTTGVPKGAWYDYRGLAAAQYSSGVMSATHDRKLIGTPFPHAGYMGKLWDQLATGSTIVISPTPWKAHHMLRQLIEERITVAGAVPTQWAKLLEQTDLDRADLSHVRLGVSATAPAPPELLARVVERIGCPLIVRYAMTESPSITGTDPGDPPEVQYRTVGRPQQGMEISIVDSGGSVVEDGGVGRVRVRGDCVMRGYWNSPERTDEVLAPDGWLTTGDLGRIRADGNLVLVGRATDMYIRGGYNVYPLEVENVLAEHPGVGRVAVVGLPAPVIGEIGAAFVVPVDVSRPPELSELRALVASRLADYKAPDRLEIVTELPVTAMLKIDKNALRAAVTA